MTSRRNFIRTAAAAALLPAAGTSQPDDHGVSLNGPWQFRLDPQNRGELEGWQLPGVTAAGWVEVPVPHTWQVQPETAGYHGVAWYRRAFEAPAFWSSQAVRIEFEAVYHSAEVWVNGKSVGRHPGKGYTAFQFDITPALRSGANVIAVRVDNAFNPNMLPRAASYDWAEDGGITRPVNLLVTPPVYIERVDVDAIPDPSMRQAELAVRVAIRNAGRTAATVPLAYIVEEEDTGRAVLRQDRNTPVSIAAGQSVEFALPARLSNPRLWHFDRPNLYRLTASIAGHQYSTTFGVRRFEVRDAGFYLNGEPVRLMGVERMAGSNPDFGMAEPLSWIEHDNRDLKELNCVFTRVHWQQDRRLLDWCDRNGILIQVEVPTWGPNTFEGMAANPDTALMDNGLEQLREMIRRDRNHPCIFAWGLCNEVNGQNPPAHEFVRRMYDEAKRLDPHRLRTYASNSLQNQTLARDAAGLTDFISWNEYYESWYRGSVEDLTGNLDRIHAAFPSKPIVVSEYGWCECNPKHIGADRRRIDVLQQHTRVFRERPWVGGAIFFSYNDYRTHIGDKGLGPLRQRVHGVVDLYGDRKPSFDVLRRESGPIAELSAQMKGGLTVRVRTRKTLPAYTLEGYTVRCTIYANGNLPMEQHEIPLPRLAPGGETTLHIAVRQAAPQRVRVEIVRPTGFSAATYNMVS
jgi:beta-glucuronidase